MTLQQDIGRKSAAKLTLDDFGTRAMTEWLTCLSKSPDVKKSLTVAQKSPPTILHAFLKNREEKSFGPGAFSFPILKRVCWIRSSVTGPKRRSWEAVSIQGPHWMTSSLIGSVCFVEPRRFVKYRTNSSPTSSTEEEYVPEGTWIAGI